MAGWPGGLLDLMFAQAGLTVPDYGFIGKRAKSTQSQYLEAVVKGYYQDYSALVVFFEEALARGYASSLAFDKERGDAPSNTED